VAEQTRLGEREGAPLYTIEHSTRSLDELVALLHDNDVGHLFDVRRFPASRRHPQFNEGNLAESLPAAGIDYTHVEEMGGRRSLDDEDSPNGAWEAEGFIAYADHARTEAFQRALGDVLARADELAPQAHACVMCAEAVYFRCHRRIISDHVVARGREVYHVFEEDRVQRHEPPDFARIREDDVLYPA
jgi:uncharacterized protein (DUF488 family)